jgi:hypothetical protein
MTEQNFSTDNIPATPSEISAALVNGRPTYLPNIQAVDMVSLAQAQGLFIVNQTQWLLQTSQFGTPEFLENLGAYSRAQTDYIAALQKALHQASVI